MENGAVTWQRPYLSEEGETFTYHFWQEKESTTVYMWREGWGPSWKVLPFIPAPGAFAFVTDVQWIERVKKGKIKLLI